MLPLLLAVLQSNCGLVLGIVGARTSSVIFAPALPHDLFPCFHTACVQTQAISPNCYTCQLTTWLSQGHPTCVRT